MDSDSDGSHISATPPRDSPPPSPPPASARPALLLSSAKSRTKFKAAAISKSTSRPILKPKPSSKCSKSAINPDPKPPLEGNPTKISLPPPDLSSLPFHHIHRSGSINGSSSFSSNCNHSVPTLLPVGRLISKFASFSKTRKENLKFEPLESNPTEPLLTTPKPKAELGDDNVVRQETGNEGFNASKVVKKHPNCIESGVSSASNASISSATRVKFKSEGNFVKLNINGYGRKKFKFKGKHRNLGSSSLGRQRFSRRRKRKFGVENKGEGEVGGLCDEDDHVLEIKRVQKISSFDIGTIEEAVMRVRDEASDENLLRLLKLSHGYDSFRNGQLEAIKMVLSKKSTMLILPTGSGKSLCYQVPALVLPGVTLVVSPLVALMIDQLKHLPPTIPGALLCSSQTPEEASEALKLLKNQTIKVLFVSPERLLNVEFTSIFSGISLISLVVIDEAHCISEWSHNFRPSYMRLRGSMLRAKLHADCVLAMTATATSKTLHNVMHALEIPATNLIQAVKMRENLQLSLSQTGNRMKDLMTLLKSSPYVEIKSIIIYCKFQSEADLISRYLCDNNISAKSYHSSIPAEDRRRIQEIFCLNKIRVVVATVAFGMGLDKRDIGAVIHYSLPESLEEYVQEIGRAGRDGRLSYCHLFFDEATYFKMRSLMYSDGVDEYAVKKFLCQIFSNTNSSGKICSIIKESASRKFDIKEELELDDLQYLNLLPQIKVTCTLNFHQTSPSLLANKDIVIAAILKKSELKDGQYVFDIPSTANSIRWQATDLSNHLKSLKLKGEITYELKDQAFCYRIVDVPNDVCSLAANITKWLSDVEIYKVRKLDAMFNAAVFAVKQCNKVDGCNDHQHTPCLQRKIFEYFNSNDDDIPNIMAESSRFLRADIKVFLQSHSQAKFTPRAVARIMHGLASPAFPSATWLRTHFWYLYCITNLCFKIQKKGRYTQVDFKVVMEAARAELMKFVSPSVV
ncbi:ATP-dependent DNA helicase Q-like 5 isoform X2 [Coffea arabica]|uniref:DNA 3'-5' helicase n=1 Tax=Coffea arabica TaxID=13443 RepID=A0ABM4WB50_COFAR